MEVRMDACVECIDGWMDGCLEEWMNKWLYK